MPPRARLLAKLVVLVSAFGLLAACSGLGLPDEGYGQKRYPNILSEATPAPVQHG